MNNDDLRTYVSALSAEISFEEGGQYLTVLCGTNEFRKLMERLRYDAASDFDYMFCLSGLDWKTHFQVVYHLESMKNGHGLVVKLKVNRENPEAPTVCDIWRTAEFHEREVFDLFGIRFKDHPDLRRLFLDDTWGFPLRKDYSDDKTIVQL
ncbi:MAG: NADH-quinone oxidoreductase subunit C [Bacteroidia bacterium]|nr:NADH-quinone oxidoreductase subunit C [Bacteroidia bacterium]